MSKSVAILTRAYNRLEYTIRTINSVKENTKHSNYKHIIVDNGSTDGTREWLTWIQKLQSPWFENVVPFLNPENSGDWGGMVVGAKKLAKNFDYIVQLDNDISVSPGWLSALIETLEATNVDSVMLKRSGVKNSIKTSNKRQIKISENRSISVVDVPFVVACYITKSSFFFKVCDKIIRCRDFGKLLKKRCSKITNINCYHIDGWEPKKKTYIQHKKYPKSKMTWEKFS